MAAGSHARHGRPLYGEQRELEMEHFESAYQRIEGEYKWQSRQ